MTVQEPLRKVRQKGCPAGSMRTRHLAPSGCSSGFVAPSPISQQGLGLVEDVHLEVEVDLLRHGLGGPARRLIVVDPLEADDEPTPAGESGEVPVAFG